MCDAAFYVGLVIGVWLGGCGMLWMWVWTERRLDSRCDCRRD